MQHLAHMLLRNEISEVLLVRLCWLIHHGVVKINLFQLERVRDR
jgi:uncharacterized membrane protein (Fun14 family)